MKLPLYEFVFVVTLAICASVYTTLFEDPWATIDENHYRHSNLIPHRPSIQRKNARGQSKEKNKRHNNEAKRRKNKNTIDDNKKEKSQKEKEQTAKRQQEAKRRKNKNAMDGNKKEQSQKEQEQTAKRQQEAKRRKNKNVIDDSKKGKSQKEKEQTAKRQEEQAQARANDRRTDKAQTKKSEASTTPTKAGHIKKAEQLGAAAKRQKQAAADHASPQRMSMRPVIIGGCAGSGTRAFVELFRRLGVIVPGNRNMDSHIGLKIARTMLSNGLVPSINHVMRKIPDGIDDQQLDEFWSSILEQFVARAETGPSGEGLMAGIKSGTKMWGFKDPENMLTLPFFAYRFPDAAVIHVVRDGRDVATSTKPMHTQFLGFARTQSTPLQRLSSWARMNMDAVETMQQYEEKGMRAWVVRLEDLFAESVDDQKSLCRAIQGALQPGGKAYRRSCTEIHEITQSVVAETLGSHTRPGSDPRSRIGKWRLQPQTFEPGLLDSNSKKALTQFGYM